MRKEKTNTTRLGLFVIIAIALFAYGVYQIGDKQSLFGATFKLSAVFKNVNGLQPGNNVRFSGINVGSVKEIVILSDSTLQVNMLLEKNLLRFLRKDAIASVGTDGLVGSMVINISPGEGKAPNVKNGDVIKSVGRVETDAVLNKLGNTTENIALLTVNLLEVVDKINKGEGSVATLLNEDDLTNELYLAIQNLRKTSENVNAISSQLDRSVNQVVKGQGLLGYLMNDKTFESKVNQTMDHLDTLVSSRTVPIMQNLEQSSKDIAESTAALQRIMAQIDLDQGLAGVLLNDSTLSESFTQTILNLNRGSALLNEDLEALQHQFLLRGAFKRMERKRKKAAQEKAMEK
jgi:phospholipid/cholesterol/gamma-HCH transport system substrate-binding protein